MQTQGQATRIFLSYGRKDARDLAMRLVGELNKRDFDVWIDKERIRGGKEWERQIIEGLRETDAVVALLSPHSTRHNEFENNDSVCLDELAWARYELPPTPIVPVLAVPGASIPLTVYRLHYLDFTDALTSDAVFQRKVEELEIAIRNVLAGTPAYRSWESWLSSNVEFERFLYSKRRNFTGREWLFDEIDVWRREASESALLITGDPGIGKSAIVAELAYGRLSGATLATYCCQWDVPETLRPATFVRSIAYQFASQIPEYAIKLETADIRKMLERVELDPSSALELGVLTPLHRIEPPSKSPSVLCLDALDEAMTFPDGPTIVNLLESRIERLPSWLRLVATTRNDKFVLRQLGGLRARRLEATGEQNLSDLRTFICNQVEEQRSPELLQIQDGEPDFINSFLKQSEGNFLYAVHFLQGVVRDKISTEELNKLPPGLFGIYERFLRRAFSSNEAVSRILPVLEILCAAAGPVPRLLLAEAIAIKERELLVLLAPLTQFLSQSQPEGAMEPSIAFWHKSFYDYLTDIEQADSLFNVDQTKGDARLASLFINRIAALGVEASINVESIPIYLRERGLDHLGRSGQFLDGVSEEEITKIAYFSSGRSFAPAVGGLLPFAPAFVSEAIKCDRLDQIGRLIDGLAKAARLHYIDAKLIRVERNADGTESRILTGKATEGWPLRCALGATEHAVWVADQVLSQRGTLHRFSKS